MVHAEAGFVIAEDASLANNTQKEAAKVKGLVGLVGTALETQVKSRDQRRSHHLAFSRSFLHRQALYVQYTCSISNFPFKLLWAVDIFEVSPVFL